MRIYFDVCCLNRPFDDQSQKRIRLESEAILLIWQYIQAGDWELVSSEMVEDEIEQTPDLERRYNLKQFHAQANECIIIDEQMTLRAKELAKAGFSSEDAIHLACAEAGRVDCFLTTDDKLRRRAIGLNPPLSIAVENPVAWLLEEKP